MKKTRLLLVEDEQILAKIICESLEKRNFEVEHAADGDQGWAKYLQFKPEIIVLDIMMPKKDGYSLAKEIRTHKSQVPIIFLSAKSQTADVVKGFEIGANDYLKKPFSMEELIVRIKSILKRNIEPEMISKKESNWQLGSLHFDFIKQTILTPNKVVKLSHREAAILRLLCQHRDHVLERRDLLISLWGDDSIFNSRSLDVFISKLRKYLKADKSIEIINIRGIGYKLIAD